MGSHKKISFPVEDTYSISSTKSSTIFSHNVYVSTIGDDTNSGSLGAPKKTLSNCVEYVKKNEDYSGEILITILDDIYDNGDESLFPPNLSEKLITVTGNNTVINSRLSIVYGGIKFQNIKLASIDTLLSKVYIGGDVYFKTDEIMLPLTPRQFRQYLIEQDMLDSVEYMIDNIPDIKQKRIIKNWWEYSSEFVRDHPLIIQFSQMLGISSTELDNIFYIAKDL